MEWVFDIAEADGAALYWWDEAQRVLTSPAHVGPLLEGKELPVIHPGQWAIGTAFSDGRPIFSSSDDTGASSGAVWVRDYGVCAEYAVPLVAGGHVLGVLSVMYGRAHDVDAAVRRRIELAARQIAPTLTVLGLGAEAEHSVSESLTLAKLIADTAVPMDLDTTCSRITEATYRLLGADFSLIGVSDATGTAHAYGAWGARTIPSVLMPKDHGRTRILTRLAERSDASCEEFAGALAEGVRTLMVIPVREDSARLGTLLAGWRVDVEPTLRQITLAETLGRHAAGVIMRARAAERSVQRECEQSSDPSALAKLLDRGATEEALRLAVADAHAHHTSLALLLVEIDRFGAVSGDMRSDIADHFLWEAGDRLRSVLQGGDRVGRLDADEFLIIVPHAGQAAARERIDGLSHILEEPFRLEGEELHFSVSIGAALYPDHGLDARTLLRHAGAAARTAKRSRFGFAFYDMESDRSAAARVSAVSALREAIAGDELVLHYQPIFDVRGGQVVQAEALCRWPTAPPGLETPDVFIPLAEHAGLIGSLTQWVVRNAVEQWARWRDVAPSSLSINISMEDLSEPDLAERLERIFTRSGVDPGRICLELTESALLVDVERSVRTLERLVAMGVSFSIDDFGTGYTSLSYLKRFPVHELKIDRSFVTNVETDPHDRTIVRSIIDLAHGLGLGVVAEGVETLGALDLLREWGCDRAQGRILASAMPPELFAERFFQNIVSG